MYADRTTRINTYDIATTKDDNRKDITLKILVAEDEVNIAESYRLILEFKGHEVTLTGDGEKCLDVYKQSLSVSPKTSRFDLIILDYRMPKKDGVQVAQEILGIVPNQRILLATAFVHDLSISRLQEIPATKAVELIQKPFDFDSFLNIVNNHSGMESASSGSQQINQIASTVRHWQNEASSLERGVQSSISTAKSVAVCQNEIHSLENDDNRMLNLYDNHDPNQLADENARLKFW